MIWLKNLKTAFYPLKCKEIMSGYLLDRKQSFLGYKEHACYVASKLEIFLRGKPLIFA